MTEILFYHLEQKPLEQVLPILLEKSLQRGWQCAVQVGDETKLTQIDKSLWTYSDESFLPHGVFVEDGENQHPILLCLGVQNPNNAQVRFYVAGAIPTGEGGYERLVFMFDGHNPDAVTAARTAWKTLSADHDTTYWQQDSNGRWSKKA